MSHKEIEIKFRVEERQKLSRQLRQLGFELVTPSTHETNTLYDRPGHPLRKRGELLRLRKYGNRWTLTHKSKGKAGRHKTRIETETNVTDGRKMEIILRSLGFTPCFRYEKFRAEWSDEKGHIVVDETPIGDFGEIEGPSRWIEQTARQLRIPPERYITDNYINLFLRWKKETRSRAQEMTFHATGRSLPRSSSGNR